MSNIIIPEIVKENRPLMNKESRFNFNIGKIENKKYEVRHQTYTNNSNNTTTNNYNNQNKGLFRSLLDLILLPITIPYNFIKTFWIENDLNNKLEIEKKKIKTKKLMKKYMTTQENIYGDELF